MAQYNKIIIKQILLLMMASCWGCFSGNAQTGEVDFEENFIAEAYFGFITTESPKVYVSKRCGHPDLFNGLKSRMYNYFCKDFNICDTTIVDELVNYVKDTSLSFSWNSNALIFQLPKYKNLFFYSENDTLNISNGAIVTDISKPAFTNNYEYALIEKRSRSSHSCERKWNWRKFKWETHCQGSSSIYHILYKKIDGKWDRIGEYRIGGS